jgi:hypothetical protein
MSASNIVSHAEQTGSLGDDESLREVLDFLVTEEQLGVTPSEAFLPVLRNGVTQEYLHVEALKEAGGKPLTTKYWFPDASLDNGGIGVFETLEVIETIEISLYLIGVSAFARRGDDLGARLCAEAMGTEAVHRALVRFAQGELGKEIGPPNDVGFENFDWPTLGAVREALEALGSVTESRPHSPAGSTNTPATRSPTASAFLSTTPSHAERTTARRAAPSGARRAHTR